MTDQRMEVLMGHLLRWGVILAATAVVAGGIAFLAGHAQERASYGSFHASPVVHWNLAAIADSAVRLDPVAMMQLGLVLLMATPVARVAFALAGFAMEKDRVYTVISAIVLAVLVVSLAGHFG